MANSLFGSTNQPVPTKAPDLGLLVTNHLNLMYMLAAGLVMPPVGFGEKYYLDVLACFPGWIPLFIGNVPRKAIQSSTSEADHLMPVIVEFRISDLSGTVVSIGADGPRERIFPDQIDVTDDLLLVAAPLPTAQIKSIVFRSADEKRACVASAGDFGNVPVKDFTLRAQSALFTKARETPWPPRDGPAERRAPLQGPLAAGGAMAMLLRFANLGEQAVRACRLAFDPEDAGVGSANDHPIFAGLGTWCRDGSMPVPVLVDSETDRVGARNAAEAVLFWQAIDRLLQWRDTGRVAAEDVLIEHLATSEDRRVKKLHDTLVSLTGLAATTASELFDRHSTPLAHAMTLFFLRRDCADLVDYQTNQLAEPDWLAAAILFGVRDGWLNLPLRLRAGRALSDAVSHRMASISHRIAGTGIRLGQAPERVRPLRELFGDGSAWRARQKSAARALSRAEKWDCVHTRVNLGPGDYRLTVKKGSTYIDLPGEPRVSPEIDVGRFFESLAAAQLEPEVESKIRTELYG